MNCVNSDLPNTLKLKLDFFHYFDLCPTPSHSPESKGKKTDLQHNLEILSPSSHMLSSGKTIKPRTLLVVFLWTKIKVHADEMYILQHSQFSLLESYSKEKFYPRVIQQLCITLTKIKCKEDHCSWRPNLCSSGFIQKIATVFKDFSGTT